MLDQGAKGEEFKLKDFGSIKFNAIGGIPVHWHTWGNDGSGIQAAEK